MTEAAPRPLLPLPRLSNEAAQVQNRLAGQSRSLPLPLVGGGEWRLQLRHGAVDDDDTASADARVWLQGTASSREFQISLHTFPPLPLLGRALGVDPTEGGESWLHNLPPDAAAALLESAGDALLPQLGKAIATAVSIRRASVEAPFSATTELAQFEFVLSDTDSAWSLAGTLDLHPETQAALAGWAARTGEPMPSAAAVAALPTVPTPMRVIVGRTSLPAREFRDLEPADILLPSEDFGFATGRCKVGVGFFGAQNFRSGFQTTEGRLVITLLEPMPETPPSTASAPRASAPSSLADVPVELVFEAGSVQVPFRELQTLQPGYTFTLEGVTLERPILIRANGHVVGEGELVQVGERLGVRIVSFRAAATQNGGESAK